MSKKKKVSIGVSGRIRKILPSESRSKCLVIDKEKNMIGIRHKNESKKQIDFYKFNKQIFGPKHDNHYVFQQLCKPLCDNILNGNRYNSMLIGYGQTGSGKTHTLLGKKQKNKTGKIQTTIGVLPLMIEYLQTNSDKVSLSAIEVYGIRKTKIHYYDLFDADKSSLKLWDKKIPIPLMPSTQTDKIWDVKSIDIDNTKNTAQKQVFFAAKNGHFAPTAKNPISSRGHIVFIVTVYKNNMFNHLIVIDLAGSEGITALPKEFRDEIGDETYKIRKMEAGIINCGLGDIQKLMKEICTKKGLSDVHGNGIRKLLYPFLRQICQPMVNVLFTFSPCKSNIESTRNTFRISKLISNLKIIPKKINDDVTQNQNQSKSKEEIRKSHEQELIAKDLFIEELQKKLDELYSEHEALKEELSLAENLNGIVCRNGNAEVDDNIEKEIKTQETFFLSECVDCNDSYWRTSKSLVLCQDKGIQVSNH